MAPKTKKPREVTAADADKFIALYSQAESVKTLFNKFKDASERAKQHGVKVMEKNFARYCDENQLVLKFELLDAQFQKLLQKDIKALQKGQGTARDMATKYLFKFPAEGDDGRDDCSDFIDGSERQSVGDPDTQPGEGFDFMANATPRDRLARLLQECPLERRRVADCLRANDGDLDAVICIIINKLPHLFSDEEMEKTTELLHGKIAGKTFDDSFLENLLTPYYESPTEEDTILPNPALADGFTIPHIATLMGDANKETGSKFTNQNGIAERFVGEHMKNNSLDSDLTGGTDLATQKKLEHLTRVKIYFWGACGSNQTGLLLSGWSTCFLVLCKKHYLSGNRANDLFVALMDKAGFEFHDQLALATANFLNAACVYLGAMSKVQGKNGHTVIRAITAASLAEEKSISALQRQQNPAAGLFVKFLITLAIVVGPIANADNVSSADPTPEMVGRLEHVMQEVNSFIAGSSLQDKVHEQLGAAFDKKFNPVFGKAQSVSILAPFFAWYEKFGTLTHAETTTSAEVFEYAMMTLKGDLGEFNIHNVLKAAGKKVVPARASIALNTKSTAHETTRVEATVDKDAAPEETQDRERLTTKKVVQQHGGLAKESGTRRARSNSGAEATYTCRHHGGYEVTHKPGDCTLNPGSKNFVGPAPAKKILANFLRRMEHKNQ